MARTSILVLKLQLSPLDSVVTLQKMVVKKFFKSKKFKVMEIIIIIKEHFIELFTIFICFDPCLKDQNGQAGDHSPV